MDKPPDKGIGFWQTIFVQLTQFVLAYGFDPSIISINRYRRKPAASVPAIKNLLRKGGVF